jgi:hypothetical protein
MLDAERSFWLSNTMELVGLEPMTSWVRFSPTAPSGIEPGVGASDHFLASRNAVREQRLDELVAVDGPFPSE